MDDLFFIVNIKDHRLYGKRGKLKKRIEGLPAVYFLEFQAGEIRAFTAREIIPESLDYRSEGIKGSFTR